VERREVIFQGHVQGVGFRYTTSRIARGHRVAGFVKNLPDGTVQLVVEGEPQELESFLDEVSQTLAPHIQHIHVHTLPATGEFANFEVRH